ncbi:hypothetical protein GI374_17005 [Paracoccus sp. S-4012]|uniref:ABC transporter permease n=1 Tax=Paracoccus sp. S-4012 TaxID=2665648 RepID=UPI0012AF358F|nr:ABC transporter permease [Paracoccus sp. S-4012]MRX52078.1 hypothetical protein [Paracoccus sp. S-4012]
MTAIDAPAPVPARQRRGFLARLLGSEYFVLWLTVGYFLVLLPFLPTLGTPANLVNLLSNMWPLLVVAIGQTFVMAVAGIDLSQGAVMALTSTLAAALLATGADPAVLAKAPIWGVLLSERGGLLDGRGGVGLALGLGLAVLAAVAVGLMNGIAVARFRMPPFMVTLVAMMIAGAFAIWLTQSENIRNLPEQFIALGKGDIVSVYFGARTESQLPRREVYPLVTYPAIVAIIVAVLAHWLLERTVFGRQVIAVGANRRAAEISGVPVVRVLILAFALSALFAAIGGLLYAARLEAGRPTLGSGTFLLDVIGATVIGGTSLFGGKARVIWTVFGVAFFVLLSNSLNLMNLSSFHVDMVKGAVILGAALLDVARTRLTRQALP